ncbi:unnamed protein product [Blepharisma stoltei]|uniref:WWE domain-containing protein n=1 Tax=Blepharisma stoltei TaxID=1481888 RepID=A0AAU9JLY6_9CILI|nr:unnamed protein product [Blepharisma stoltei]
MKCFFCMAETEHFCLCLGESSIVCEKHALWHTNKNPLASHKFEKIDHYPNNQEKIMLANNLKEKISILETIKSNKIKEKRKEIERILNEFQKTLKLIDEDIWNLSCLIKTIFSSKKFSRIENSAIISLFNSSYEQTIKILEDNGWLNFQKFIKISSKYHYKEAQVTRRDQISLDSKYLLNPANNLEIPSLQSIETYREIPKSNAVWSKLTEDGTFVPYSQADNDIIESSYQKKDPFASIGGDGSQCFVSLTSPILEIQEVRSLITKVLRNNSPEIFDSRAILKPWYYKSDKGWEVMAPEASRIAEYAYQNDYKEALIQGENKKSYRLDLVNMKQINPKTNYQRDIRRGNELGKVKKT